MPGAFHFSFDLAGRTSAPEVSESEGFSMISSSGGEAGKHFHFGAVIAANGNRLQLRFAVPYHGDLHALGAENQGIDRDHHRGRLRNSA